METGALKGRPGECPGVGRRYVVERDLRSVEGSAAWVSEDASSCPARLGKSTRAALKPISAPMSWAAIKAGTSWGRMPAKVFDNERAMVIAGLAKEVEAVNQYAAPIHAATIHAAS